MMARQFIQREFLLYVNGDCLSEAEIAFALQHQYKLLKLGPRVLRTETAAIAALSVLQFAYGDFA